MNESSHLPYSKHSPHPLNPHGSLRYKIVILGSMGAGKTTLIRSVAGEHMVDTDVHNHDSGHIKPTTTVAMDYAEIPLPEGDRLSLYGAPGQDRFDFMWNHLIQGAHGLIILIDAHQAHPSVQLEQYINHLKQHEPIPTVIGLTHMDLVEKPDEIMQTVVQRFAHLFSILPIDAREPEHLMLLMDVLFQDMDPILASMEEPSFQEDE